MLQSRYPHVRRQSKTMWQGRGRVSQPMLQPQYASLFDIRPGMQTVQCL